LGVRQFNARATSSAKRFLPIPSSPVNSIAPGSRSLTSMRFSAALTREFPVSSSNISHFQLPIANCQLILSIGNRQSAIGNRNMAPALEIRNDDFSHALLRFVDWSTRVDQLHAFGFFERDLEVRITHTAMKVGVLDIKTIA